MNLQHLKYFIELAHTHSYSSAAEILHITQPSLTYAINQLEDELGVPLFIKNGRNNVLTSYGSRFLIHAQGALQTLERGMEELHTSSHEETIIRIGFLRYMGINYIPELIRGFQEAYPDYHVKFEVETGNTKLLLGGISDSRFDVVFCAPAAQVQKYGTMIGKQIMHLITPIGHPLAEKKRIHLEESFMYPYVYYARGSSMRNIIEKSYPNLSEKLDMRYQVMEEDVAMGFVASGFGIGIVPDLNIYSRPVAKVELIDPPIERDLYMVPTATREMTPALQLFIQYAKRV